MQINRISIPIMSNRTQSKKQEAPTFGSFKLQILDEVSSNGKKHGEQFKDIFKGMVQKLRERGYHFELNSDIDCDIYTIRGKSGNHEFELAEALSNNKWEVFASDIDSYQSEIAPPVDKNLRIQAKEELKKLGLR